MVFLVSWAAGSASGQGLILPGLASGQLSEADLSRNATITIVWASWSPRGQDIVARVNAIHSRWNSRVRVVTINFQEDPAAVQRFLGGKGLAAPVFLDRDGDFAKKFAVTNLPGLVVFRDGQTPYQGRLPDDPDSVLNEIFR
jgi:thioredoxin-like negative regulator of GroEL